MEASDFDEDTLKKECADADAVVCCYAKITSSVIDAMKKCKVIVKAGMGVNNIDISAATEHGIMVANVQKYCLDEVSDHAIALILTLIRKTAYMDRQARAGKWKVLSPVGLFSELRTWFFVYMDLAALHRIWLKSLRQSAFR